MEIQKDGSGQPYFEIGNVRVTLVRAKDRPDGKDWAGQDVLRIQAYKNTRGGPMYMGPEIPAAEAKTVLAFVEAVSRLAAR